MVYTEYENNLYYYPEKSGLKIVAELEYSSGSYEFDTRVVWKNVKGELFTARDSGCSCPTPFEEYNLTNIDPVRLDDLVRETSEELAKEYRVVTHDEVQEFLEKVRTEIRASANIFRQDS